MRSKKLKNKSYTKKRIKGKLRKTQRRKTQMRKTQRRKTQKRKTQRRKTHGRNTQKRKTQRRRINRRRNKTKMSGGSLYGKSMITEAVRQGKAVFVLGKEIAEKELKKLTKPSWRGKPSYMGWNVIYTEMMKQPPGDSPLEKGLSKVKLKQVQDIYNEQVKSEVANGWFTRLNVTLPKEMSLIEESPEWDKPEAVWKKEYEESEKQLFVDVAPQLREMEDDWNDFIKLLKLLRLRKLSNNAHMMWCRGEKVSSHQSLLEEEERREQAATADLRFREEKQRNAEDFTRKFLGGDFVKGGGALNAMGVAEQEPAGTEPDWF